MFVSTMHTARSPYPNALWDRAILAVLPILSAIISLNFHTNYLISTLLFFGLPSLWLAIQEPSRVAKALCFSGIFLILIEIADYIATLNGQWFIVSTVFPFRLFDVIPIEDCIWTLLATFCTVMYYEHFINAGTRELMNGRMKYFIGILCIATGMLIIGRNHPVILTIRYAYFLLGTALIIVPAFVLLSLFPPLRFKFALSIPYFFFLALLFELTALQLNQWIFPSKDYIGWIGLFGHRLPLEEFLFWCVLGAVCVLNFYEFFDDDRK